MSKPAAATPFRIIYSYMHSRFGSKLFYCGPLGFSAEAAGLSASLRASLQQRRTGFIQSHHLRVSPSVNSRIWDCSLGILWTFLPHNGLYQRSKPPTDAEIAPTSSSLLHFELCHYGAGLNGPILRTLALSQGRCLFKWVLNMPDCQVVEVMNRTKEHSLDLGFFFQGIFTDSSNQRFQLMEKPWRPVRDKMSYRLGPAYVSVHL